MKAGGQVIEAEIRGRSAEERRSERQERSRPLVAALHAYLVEQLARVPGRSRVAEAIRYAISRWEALSLYLDDGRVEMDTNTVERVIRPVALTRKNSPFAGSDGGGGRWARIASLIETAKLNGVEPFAYLADVLARMSTGHPARDLDALLPWNWTPVVKTAQQV
jgi:hypothetical protein